MTDFKLKLLADAKQPFYCVVILFLLLGLLKLHYTIKNELTTV